MIRWDTETKLKTLITLTHLIFLFGIFLISSVGWEFYLLTFLSVIIIGKIGGEIGFHRYFSHKSFKTSYWKSRILLILGSLNLVGSSLSWCGTHRVHHRFTDTEKDPHSPYFQNPWKIWLIMWEPFQIGTRDVSDMIRDPWQVFIHKWYFELAITLIIVLGIINFKILLFGLLLPSILQFHTGALLIDIVCHKFGYRNYETKDHSRNNTWVNLFTGGSGLHNNHHAQPGNPYYAHKKWEWDLPGVFIRKVLV
jgi:stearoyl-CoA desaturase (delta-9 desaturase)